MPVQLKPQTVAELHAQLQVLIDQGHGHIPVCATDCRARYPFEAYPVLSPAGYEEAFLINVRTDAHFAQPDPVPFDWGSPSRVTEWNEKIDAIKERCGAFA